MYMYPGPSGESTTTIFCITESTPYDLKTTSSKEYYHHQAFVRQRSQTKTKKKKKTNRHSLDILRYSGLKCHSWKLRIFEMTTPLRSQVVVRFASRFVSSNSLPQNKNEGSNDHPLDQKRCQQRTE